MATAAFIAVYFVLRRRGCPKIETWGGSLISFLMDLADHTILLTLFGLDSIR